MNTNTKQATVYRVYQKFETLGDPSETTHTDWESADRAATGLKNSIAEMISEWETPESRTEGGFSGERLVWDEAAKMIGLEFSDTRDRTDDSPLKYGLEAGKLIAERAVVVEEVDV